MALSRDQILNAEDTKIVKVSVPEWRGDVWLQCAAIDVLHAEALKAVREPGAKEKIEGYIAIGKAEGTLLTQGAGNAGPGHFVPSTVFTDIAPDSRLAREEIFGPVVCIFKAADFDEALQLANNTPYALTGGLFSRSPANIERACREFMVGSLYINRGTTGAMMKRHPFGGFRLSGVGSKAMGTDYLPQFMYSRTIVENTFRSGFAPMKSEASGE